MEQPLSKKTSSAREGSWLTRIFSFKPPLEEKPAPKPLCGAAYDWSSDRHKAKDPKHQDVLDIFDRWRGIGAGTFSIDREMALFRLFGITDVVDRVREYNRDVCPAYGWGLDMSDYSGFTKTVMEHTRGIHLNRSGIDHFGVPVFDFELLRAIGETKALADIRISITASLKRREGRDADTAAAYYIFQGMRMIRLIECLGGGECDWETMGAMFPHVPVPGGIGPEASMSETEKLESRAFRMHLNRSLSR